MVTFGHYFGGEKNQTLTQRKMTNDAWIDSINQPLCLGLNDSSQLNYDGRKTTTKRCKNNHEEMENDHNHKKHNFSANICDLLSGKSIPQNKKKTEKRLMRGETG